MTPVDDCRPTLQIPLVSTFDLGREAVKEIGLAEFAKDSCLAFNLLADKKLPDSFQQWRRLPALCGKDISADCAFDERRQHAGSRCVTGITTDERNATLTKLA